MFVFHHHSEVAAEPGPTKIKREQKSSNETSQGNYSWFDPLWLQDTKHSTKQTSKSRKESGSFLRIGT
jgi:hypothetical protein